ncbi:MAG: hypothetical protein KKA31_00725 [Candidatus Margulisbacteria bacterium]|nr:hypothetical protein [Candidatus Margulisiibacteriota bacterium]
MKKLLAVLLVIGLVGVGIVLSGCTEKLVDQQASPLVATSQTPSLGASGVGAATVLSVTFKYQMQYVGITKDNLITEYLVPGPAHTASTPTISEIQWTNDYKTLNVAVSSWVNQASGAVVQYLPRPITIGWDINDRKIQKSKLVDVFDNGLDLTTPLWQYTII